jgi:hypothetical protein
MKLPLSAACAAVLALAVPAAASAATFAPQTPKPCYRSGEKVNLVGTGFTASVPSGVNVTSDNPAFGGGSLTSNELGVVVGELTLGQASGRRTSTYTATDTTNPALTASTQLTVSAVEVGVRPRNGRPGRRVRIGATGFTTGTRLWVHVRKGRFKRDFKIGRLKGACKRLVGKTRILPRGAATGIYRVQFDTFRRYKKSRVVRALFTITVSRTLRPSAAASASALSTRWDRLL